MKPANESWRWLGSQLMHAVHDEQLAEHSGAGGVRDAGLLESALARPRHLAQYGEPDVADLAASYAFGIARNHPFVDGNKRTAFVAAQLFLRLNGFRATPAPADSVFTVLALAAGELSEAQFADWLRRHLQPR